MTARPTFQSDAELRLAIYRFTAETTRVPTVAELATLTGLAPQEVRAALARLAAEHVIVLNSHDGSIRMAAPFSGIATQHLVRTGGKEYFANCAWDALGVIAALGGAGEVVSRCEQSLEPIQFRVGAAGPEAAPCIVHFAVPAARWWQDIVFT
jgi:hypothetical protein